MSKGRYTPAWTAPAEEYLLVIARFIKQDNPDAARLFAKQIKGKVKRLRTFPYSGWMVPEFSVSTLREIVIGNYRIVYRVLPEKKRLEILTVFPGAGQFPSD